MSDVYRERARHSEARIRNSIFSTASEQADAAKAISALESSLTQEGDRVHINRIEEILESVMTREAGTAGLSMQNRRKAEQNVKVLEAPPSEKTREDGGKSGQDVRSAASSPQPLARQPQPTRLEIKIAKWWFFSMTIIIFTVAVDLFAAISGPGTANFVTVFGGGDLFAAALGLSAAATGDMICDRFFAPNPGIIHLRWLSITVVCMLVSAVAYFWAKETLGLAAFLEDSRPASPSLIEVADNAFWIALFSPLNCIAVAFLAFHAVKRSEP